MILHSCILYFIAVVAYGNDDVHIYCFSCNTNIRVAFDSLAFSVSACAFEDNFITEKRSLQRTRTLFSLGV